MIEFELPLVSLPVMLVVLGCTSAHGESTLIAPDAQVTKLADSFKFTEGPAADAKGNVYFTDQPNDRIMKWSVDGKLSTFMQPAGRANGMFFDKAGDLYACADEKNELWLISQDGSHQVLVRDFKDKLLNGPNDVWVRPDGGLYFTDPLYKRDYWQRGPMEQDGECVYFLSADRKTLTRVDDQLVKPNGIVGTPDGKTLYVADIRDNKTYRYKIEPDGSLSDRRIFCEMGSDGMTLDAQGNLYLTGKGVTIFNPQGEKIENIPIEEGWTANVCFGGANHDVLFITASPSLYSVKMKVKGAR